MVPRVGGEDPDGREDEVSRRARGGRRGGCGGGSGWVLRALSGSDIHVPRLFLTCMELGLWGTRIEW